MKIYHCQFVGTELHQITHYPGYESLDGFWESKRRCNNTMFSNLSYSFSGLDGYLFYHKLGRNGLQDVLHLIFETESMRDVLIQAGTAFKDFYE